MNYSMQIPWDKLPDGEWQDDIVDWTPEDKRLATLAILVCRNLEDRLPKKREGKLMGPFVKLPDLANGIANSMWYADKALADHVKNVILIALLMYTHNKLQPFFEKVFAE